MKKVLVGFLTLVSMCSYAGVNCTTSEGEVLKISPMNGKLGFLLERTAGASVETDLFNKDELIHVVSKDQKSIKISFSRLTRLGTAKIDDKLVSVDCE